MGPHGVEVCERQLSVGQGTQGDNRKQSRVVLVHECAQSLVDHAVRQGHEVLATYKTDYQFLDVTEEVAIETLRGDNKRRQAMNRILGFCGCEVIVKGREEDNRKPLVQIYLGKSFAGTVSIWHQ